MKILGPKETGTGILIEYDAGHVSPEDNKKIISEMKNVDFSEDLILMPFYKNLIHLIKMAEYTPKYY
jgi:hypothetical protein